MPNTQYQDVLRGLFVEIHSRTCKDVEKARRKGFSTGALEGDGVEDAIAESIRNLAGDGVKLDRECYRIMPCVKEPSENYCRLKRAKRQS